MTITVAGRTFRIEKQYIKSDGSIRVMIEQDGRAIVSYAGSAKMYICSLSKARKLWAAA